MKLLKLVPERTEIPFIKVHMIAYAASVLAILASAALFVTMGLNFGIDFRGGILFEIAIKGPPGTATARMGEVRQVVNGLGLGEVQVQEFGSAEQNAILISIVSQSRGIDDPAKAEAAENAAKEKVRNALTTSLGNVEFRREEVVGPKVSGELVREGVMAVALAVIMMLVYIWFRFEWQFSIGAVMALVHDVILTIGIFSLLQWEFNLSIIAALLTIVGYSMNDTVVVYDRVRENLRKYKRMELPTLLDRSINDTLSRTMVTSVTTLLALLALFFFGGPNIKGFTFGMIWGVVVGTYSSIFIASPLLLLTGVKRDWSGIEAKPAAARAR